MVTCPSAQLTADPLWRFPSIGTGVNRIPLKSSKEGMRSPQQSTPAVLSRVPSKSSLTSLATRAESTSAPRSWDTRAATLLKLSVGDIAPSLTSITGLSKTLGGPCGAKTAFFASRWESAASTAMLTRVTRWSKSMLGEPHKLIPYT
jgi:hypothetical protein